MQSVLSNSTWSGVILSKIWFIARDTFASRACGVKNCIMIRYPWCNSGFRYRLSGSHQRLISELVPRSPMDFFSFKLFYPHLIVAKTALIIRSAIHNCSRWHLILRIFLSRKWYLAFHVNLWRVTWNAKSYFLWNIIEKKVIIIIIIIIIIIVVIISYKCHLP